MAKNDLNFNQCSSSIIFMREGETIVPTPEVLTEEEAIQFLRLDIDGPKNPKTTLQYYREQGLLRACQIGKNLRYSKTELLRFIELLTDRTNAKAS